MVVAFCMCDICASIADELHTPRKFTCDKHVQLWQHTCMLECGLNDSATCLNGICASPSRWILLSSVQQLTLVYATLVMSSSCHVQ